VVEILAAWNLEHIADLSLAIEQAQMLAEQDGQEPTGVRVNRARAQLVRRSVPNGGDELAFRLFS
jgi:hypothetical protein